MKNLILPLFFLPYLATFAQCNYLAYESFSYPTATNLHAQQGGTGWSNPWATFDNNPVTGFVTSNTSFPVFSNLLTTGNYLSNTDNATLGRKLDDSANGNFKAMLRADNNGIGKHNTTLWLSAMIRKSANSDEKASISLTGSDLGWILDRPWLNEIGFGYFGTASNDASGHRKWSLKIKQTISQTGIDIVENETIFMVMSIRFDELTEHHQINLYINPTPGIVPISPSISGTFDEWLTIKSLGLQAQNAQIDEIRVADNYNCVAPTTTTLVNQFPTALFSTTPNSGNSPINIVFDASLSTDSDGSIVAYEWDFGDGSPEIITNIPSINHIYSIVGLLTARLRVRDNLGGTQNHSATVIIRNSAGTLSCQSSIRLEQMASCGEANGAIRFIRPDVGQFYHLNVNSAILTNSSAISMPPSGGLEWRNFQNLPAGNYTMTVNGDEGCSDIFHVIVPTDSNTCVGWKPKFCDLGMGMNLNFPLYYNTERPFKNLFKLNSGFFTVADTSWRPTFQIQHIAKDANGYPLSLPWVAAGSGVNHFVKAVVADGDYFKIMENYVLLYDGVGNLNLVGVNNLIITPNRITFTKETAGSVVLEILTSQLGNRVRNIRIVKLQDELVDLEANPFNQNFLNHLSKFSTIRFMNWQLTNTPKLKTWSQRNLPNYYNQAQDSVGVAFEYIVRLGNTLKKDIWVNIPHTADASFVQNMAEFFRDNLDPNLKIYVEYSNEVWNFGFEQSHWVYENGASNRGLDRKYVDFATKTFKIWTTAFGSQANRIKRVLGTQAQYSAVGEGILAHADPADYDYLSPTVYFRYDGYEHLLNATITPLQVINYAKLAFRNTENYQFRKQDYLNAKLFGKEIINYETGNHFNLPYPRPVYSQAVIDAQTHPEMFNLYQEVIDSLRKLDSKLAMWFVLSSKSDVSSSDVFGHLDDTDQDTTAHPAPKFRVLLHNTCQTMPCQSSYTITTPIDAAFTEFQAGNTIEAFSTTKFYTNTTLKAGRSITFLPNFSIEKGAVFRANIDGCGSSTER